MNMKDLITLAKGTVGTDEFDHYDQLPAGIREALVEEMEAEKKLATRNAAKTIMSILKQSDERVQYEVRTIREARKVVDASKARLKRVEDAKEYGLRTNNFIPLMKELNMIDQYSLRQIMQETPSLLLVVPEVVEKVEA